MEKYHKYIFDLKERKFVGEFEKMYTNEVIENFDSWHQEDSRELARKICVNLLNDHNFDSVLDIGCGKGYFTHLLKKKNNYVLGIDVSKTAVSHAKSRFPDIDFKVLNIKKIKNFEAFLSKREKFSLIVLSEVLSYIPHWPEIISMIAGFTDFILIKIYLPDNPIGFIKSEPELVNVFKEHFSIIDHINIKSQCKVILFGQAVKTYKRRRT